MSLKLEDDFMCYVCGKNNPQGLRLDFEQPEKGRLTASIVFSKHHQGFKNIVHGGMVASVLDEMMVNLAWKEGLPAVTAELNIRLKKAILVGQKVLLEGRFEKVGEWGKGRVLYASATARDEKGEILASATATCIRISSKTLEGQGK